MVMGNMAGMVIAGRIIAAASVVRRLHGVAAGMRHGGVTVPHGTKNDCQHKKQPEDKCVHTGSHSSQRGRGKPARRITGAQR